MRHRHLLFFTFSCLGVFILPSCNSEVQDSVAEKETTSSSDLIEIQVDNEISKQYDLSYFSGKAEVNTYKLEKARYNGVHPGESVLIFVTEPFLVNEQVKSDHPEESESVSVLKMNRIDRFSTGIYDYSVYTSVFTPTSKFDPIYPLKATMSSQDWCGQSFMQLNNNKGFDYMLRSYFESEGDTTQHLDYAINEDNLFNLARVDTALLPKGEFDIVPTMAYLRLSHSPLKAYRGNASLANLENQVIYSYDIPELKRGVRIFMNPKNNFQIVRWEETYPTLFDGKLRKSTYTLKHSERLPYWELNQAEDNHLRDSFQLKVGSKN
jgi:hypothetical protein